MSIAVFHTYAFVKRLAAAGMPEAQAEVLADEQMRLIDDRLATKEDIARLRADGATLQAATKADSAVLQAATKADVAALEASTKTNLAETKADILKWMIVGLIGFQTIIILGAVIALARRAP